ncbi:MucBP domain-containing protein [Enterococcus raffinosus]|uniref:MucBP domain-containing protein n=1 Tax=Enterococcus raffinosus TaxID=71452 RepID=UPI00288D1BD3|nr:MucBP domain-containing protein [Enterococcus raffinosus]MDT2525128.1 MucBP domain-containing protein [Enterococcus raffinosus]MDT2592483.1 MucBP domain-containing protein [Enterococcus raffinosus]
MKKSLLSLGIGLGLLVGIGATTHHNIVEAAENSSNQMYRLYNKNSGEHFYTKNASEKDHLKKVGWKYEGIGWQAPLNGQPVYRLYNKNAGDHHYTLNKNEKDHLVKVGWKYEGIGWYSDNKKAKPLYRAYNPNAKAGSHNYTLNYNEQKNLLNHGWKNEGIAWYGVSESITPSNPKPKVDKSKLNDLVSKLSKKSNDHYSQSSWSAFQTSLNEAKKVLGNVNSTQTNIDQAYQKLSLADKNLQTQYYNVLTRYIDESGNVLGSKSEKVKSGTKFTVYSREFDGYNLIGNNSQAGVINSNKTFIFSYKKKSDQKKVTINYVDSQGYGISEPTVMYVKKGESYTAQAKTFEGFRVDGKTNKTEVINDDTSFTFKYVLTHSMEIKYVDLQGNEISSSDHKVVDDGQVTSVYAKNINGYVLNGDNVQTATVNYDNFVITFQYLKKLKITANYVDIDSGKNLNSKQIDAVEGRAIEINQEQFNGYSLFGTGKQSIVPTGNQTVVFNYKLTSKVVEKVRNDAFNSINNYRSINGLKYLNSVDTLNKGADIRSLEIQDKPNHERPDGTLGITVADEVGYTNYIVTENIGWDKGKNAEDIFNNGGEGIITQWKNSPSHDQAMKISKLNEAGIGVNVRNNFDGSVNVGYTFLGGHN